MTVLKLSDLKPAQILIILALAYLNKYDKDKKQRSPEIQNICKKYFCFDMDNSTFNNCMSGEKRRGLVRFGLISSEIGAGNQKYHMLELDNVKKVFFRGSNSKMKKEKEQKLLRMIEIASHIAYNLGYGFDNNISKLEKKRRKKSSNDIAKIIKDTLVRYTKTGFFHRHLLDEYPILFAENPKGN